MHRPSLPLLLALAACAAPTDASRIDAADQPVVQALAQGTLLRVAPALAAPRLELAATVVDAWFREALRQSDWLDIAAGPVATTAAAPTLTLRFDAVSQAAIASLVDSDPPRQLAAVSIAGRPVDRALDELAVRVRRALGDPLREEPLPLARIYSARPEVVAACEAALEDEAHGAFAAAEKRLLAVRARDGGSAFLLDVLASALSVRGDAVAARRIADEALALADRRGPTTTHRLLRTLLLARASLEPDLAARYDEELWTLAQVAGRERPHDPEVRFTRGLTLNFQGRFAEAAATLAELQARMPDHAGVLYHLGWARLGTGDGAAAQRAFDGVARTLPLATTVVPRALARFATGDHVELGRFLAELADEPRIRDGAALHEVRRMQAAHALLRGDIDAAVATILADLTWLLAHPSVLELRAGELVDTATVLAQLGRTERLRPLLAGIDHQWPDSVLADAAAYATGLCNCAAAGNREPAVEAALQQRGRGVWSDTLAAFGHRYRGELRDEHEALARAARQSSSPLLKAALVDNLVAIGRADDAALLRDALRRELTAVDLRRRSQHPLLGPELAMAWLAGERVSR